MVTDEARRLFAVVVNELWHKHPELVVPGWLPTGDGRFSTDTRRSFGWEDVFPDLADDADILAAAALCAEFMNRHTVLTTAYSEESPEPMWKVHCDGFGTESWWPCWVSAQFAAILAEKGIEHE